MPTSDTGKPHVFPSIPPPSTNGSEAMPVSGISHRTCSIDEELSRMGSQFGLDEIMKIDGAHGPQSTGGNLKFNND
jgi:hypothetical protein